MQSGHGLFGVVMGGILTVSVVYIVLQGNSGKNATNLQSEVSGATKDYSSLVGATSGMGGGR